MKVYDRNGPKNVTVYDACEYDYDGTGLLYQLVAGPLFNNIYIVAGIFLGFAADLFNRKILLVISLVWWSVMTGLTGLTHKYWQLALLRFSVAIGYVLLYLLLGSQWDISVFLNRVGYFCISVFVKYSGIFLYFCICKIQQDISVFLNAK